MGGFTREELYLTVYFVPGSVQPTNTAFLIGLDIDENPATGAQPPDAPTGAEYKLLFNSQASQTAVSLAGGGTTRSLPIVFGSNSFRIVVPLSLLGNDDGAMLFGIALGEPIINNAFRVCDFVPGSDASGRLILGGPTMPMAQLSVKRQTNTVVLGWPNAFSNHVLEASSASGVWSPISDTVVRGASESSVVLSNLSGAKLFRLKHEL